MKIIIITGVAPPEPGTAGRIHWDMAMHFSQNKNEVWLISPKPSRPVGSRYPDIKHTKINRINSHFYHVQLNSFTCPEYKLFMRAYESLSFGIHSIRFINKQIRDYDLIYASPWAFLGQLFILIMQKDKTKPVIMNVQDLYPESFLLKLNSGLLRRIFKPLYQIDRYIAKKSSHITVICDSLKEVYVKNRKVAEKKVSVLKNWQDESEFLKPLAPRFKLLEKYDLNDLINSFIYMYLGNIGPVAGVETIIPAFAALKCDKSVLIIAGSGTWKDKCRGLAGNFPAADIRFIEVPPGLKAVVELQSLSDILLLPINPEAANSSIPSKLIAYMFSGKPVITSASGKSETANVIRDSGCGWITQSHDVREWAKIMQGIYKMDKSELGRMGRNGFDYAMNNYTRMTGLDRINQLITTINNQYYEERKHSGKSWLYRRPAWKTIER